MPASVALNPKHWRKRAEEARNLADKMNDPLAKAMMLLIAKDHELLAERAEERAENLATRKRPTTSRAEGVAQRMSVRPPTQSILEAQTLYRAGRVVLRALMRDDDI